MDWKYVTRGRGVVTESAIFGLLTLLSFTVIPIFMIWGYFYQSYLNLIRGKNELPDWDLANTFVKGLILFGYMLGLTILASVILLPLLLLDSVTFLIGAIVVTVLTTYLFPLLVLSHEIDMDFISVATSGNYFIGLTLSVIVFIGAYIVIIALYIAIYIIGTTLIVGSAIGIGLVDPSLIAIVFILTVVIAIPLFVLLNGLLYVALHTSLIPLGEKLNDEIYDGRNIVSNTPNSNDNSNNSDEWTDT